jgi:hypothetical protein
MELNEMQQLRSEIQNQENVMSKYIIVLFNNNY